MGIKQFNASYVSQEDRVLFRFNTQTGEEYRFWLTRRMMLFLLAATAHLSEKRLAQTHPTTTAKVINEFQQEVAKEKANFSEEYAGAKQLPLGSDPILIIDVRCTLLNPETQAVMSLDFVLLGDRQVNLKLPLATVQSMCVLLERLKDQARWNETEVRLRDTPTEGDTPPADPKHVH